MKSRTWVRICAAVALALAAAWMSIRPIPARADIGWPPLSPGGSSLEVPEGVNTNVRMMEEVVDLTIEPFERPVPQGQEDSPAYHMRALVEAVFQMRNLGTAGESFDVWFPLAASLRYPGMLAYTPENIVTDFKVWVDGLPTAVEQVQAPDVGDPGQQSTWARFPVNFPAGQDVTVRVNYTLYPSGRRPFGGFEYILQTGAGWRGTIGSATVNVYLPDTVTPENVSLSGKSIEGLPISPQPAGYRIENNVIGWQFSELEPTGQDNIFVEALEPARYRDLLRARGRVAGQPDSVEAQLDFAGAARNAVLVVKLIGQHGGGEALAEQANAAYRRALELAPQRVDIYVDYAQWLMQTGGWVSLMRDGTCPPELCDLVSRGLEQFPGNPDLVELDNEIRLLQAETAPFATQAALDRTATAAAAPRQDLSATGTAAALLPGVAPETPTEISSATPPATPTEAPQATRSVHPAVWVPIALVAVLFLLLGMRQRSNRGGV